MGAVRELIGLGGRGKEARKATQAPPPERSVTIDGSAEELYRAWRDAGVIRQVMAHFADVSPTEHGLLHWVIAGPFGQSLAWDTRLVEEGPFALRWAPTEGGLAGELRVRLHPAPAGRGTILTVGLRFTPDEGSLAEAARKLERSVFGRAVQARAARNFKSLFEAGEIPTTARQPAARNGGRDP